MKTANVKKVIKTIGKVVAIYYIIELVVLVASTIFCAITYGTDTVKKIFRNTWCHIKNMGRYIFPFKWKEAVREATDNSLDGSYVCLNKACGKAFTDSVMESVYDTLDKGVLPFSRNRCPADKKKPTSSGLNTILKQVVHSGEYPEYDLDKLEEEIDELEHSSSFETHPIDPDEVPADILRSAGDID